MTSLGTKEGTPLALAILGVERTMADPVFSGEEGSEDSCPLSEGSSSSGGTLANNTYQWKVVDGDYTPAPVDYVGGDHVVVFYATSSITVRVPKQKESGAVPEVMIGNERVEKLRRRAYSVSPTENTDVVLEVRVRDGFLSRVIVTWGP